MSGLSKTLKDEIPIERVVAKCGKCSFEIFDSKKSSEDWPVIVGDIIEVKYEKHRNETSHNDLNVAIDKPMKMKREIDCTVTVNG